MNGRDHAPTSQDWRSRLERMVVEFPSETLEKAPFRGVANPKVGTIAANNTKPALVQAAFSNFSSSPRTKIACPCVYSVSAVKSRGEMPTSASNRRECVLNESLIGRNDPR